MKDVKVWTDQLASGRVLRHGQHENGMHWATIYEYGIPIAGTVVPTPADIGCWLGEQGDKIIEPETLKRGEYYDLA